MLLLQTFMKLSIQSLLQSVLKKALPILRYGDYRRLRRGNHEERFWWLTVIGAVLDALLMDADNNPRGWSPHCFSRVARAMPSSNPGIALFFSRLNVGKKLCFYLKFCLVRTTLYVYQLFKYVFFWISAKAKAIKSWLINVMQILMNPSLFLFC